MSKKIAALIGAGALFLAAAAPALAWWSSDTAYVSNSAVAVATTGGNGQGNGAKVNNSTVGGWCGSGSVTVSGTNSMTTGDADATATAGVVANTHKGCLTCGWWHTDFASVNNSAVAVADTGNNGQGNGLEVNHSTVGKYGSGLVNVSGNNTMNTGDASATSRAWVMVNIH